MSRLNGLQVALDLARSRRDSAVRQLAQTREKWAAAHRQLEQLESYAVECADRWLTQSARCTPDLLRHHYQFMDRLAHASALQTGILSEHSRNVARDTNALREAEGRLESLRQLCLARQRELARADDRREQKQSDEQAALAHLRLATGRLGLGFS